LRKINKIPSLFELQDYFLSLHLLGKPDIKTFVDVIENRCSDDEADKILIPLLIDEDDEKVRASKELFYSKLTPDELTAVKKRIKNN